MGETLRAAAGYCRVADASDIFYSAPVIRSRADELGQPVSHREKLPCGVAPPIASTGTAATASRGVSPAAGRSKSCTRGYLSPGAECDPLR